MLRHVVLFGWTPEATDAQKQRVAAELAKLPSLIPGVRAYTFGPDAGINEASYDFGLVADFDDADSYRAYRDDPRHRAVVDQHIMPIVARRAAVQYEF
jgi:Stress responsive A/B Barrel Domain